MLHAIRKMRGGAQSLLMFADDGNFWVVKFQNNPQHLRVLANELFVSRIAEAVGLSVPQSEVVEVSPWSIGGVNNLDVELGHSRREAYLPGLQFGSRLVSGDGPGTTSDYLPDEQLCQLSNLEQFAGVLALDKWTANCDARQAVFVRTQRGRRYRAAFIDQGFCFNAGDWSFPDAPLRGVYRRPLVYSYITGWNYFSPWLEGLEEMPIETLWSIAKSVPPQWYGGDLATIERLTEKLFKRRSRIRDLITEFRKSDRDPFPLWDPSAQVSISNIPRALM